jgi:putative YhbY family RNA-binding protein
MTQTSAAPTISAAERRALKARAHALTPVAMIGSDGLTPAVLNEIDRNLHSHELIKIRVLSDSREARSVMLADICEALTAVAVQHIGKIFVVFRVRAEDEKISAVTRKKIHRRRQPRRTKRSFQH